MLQDRAINYGVSQRILITALNWAARENHIVTGRIVLRCYLCVVYVHRVSTVHHKLTKPLNRWQLCSGELRIGHSAQAQKSAFFFLYA